MKAATKLFLFVTISFLFHSSCSENEANNVEISIGKTGSVILDESEPLFGKFHENFRINNTGEFWVFADRIQNKLFVFNKEGEFVSMIGERGRGPNGILSIGGFDINEENEVLIYDSSQRMLKKFNLEGDLINSVNFFDDVEFGTTALEMHSHKNKLLFSIIESQYGREPHKSKLLAFVDYSGVVDTVFGMHDPFAQEDNHYSFQNRIAWGKNENQIFTNLTSSPYIQMYDGNNYQQIDYFGESTKSFSLPGKEIHPSLPILEVIERSTNTSANLGLYLTEEFVIQHMQILTEEWFEMTDFSLKENILVIYDKKTREFVQELSVEHTLGAVQNNQLYFIEDFNPDNYTIGVYELKSEK